MKLGLLCASAVLTIARPALAAKTFILDNVTLQFAGQDKGTLTGSFTTDDAFTKIEAIDITGSAFTIPGFNVASYTYNNIANIDTITPITSGFRLTVVDSTGNHQLRLDLKDFTDAGATILTSSYEQSGGINRTVAGGSLVGESVPAVPEPATWGLMLVGFGLMGTAIRRRNLRTSVRFA